jgi:hypothetical protein
LALVVVPGLAEAAMWLGWYVLLPNEGDSFEGALFAFGAPAIISALVVYRLAEKRRIAWAVAAVLATPAWFFVFWLAAVAVFDPD